MLPVLFKVGPFAVHAYGFMVAVAFLVGVLLSIHFARREGVKAETVLDLTLYVIVASIVGSRLMYVLGTLDQYRDNPWEIFMVQKGGLAFLGGLLLGLLVLSVLARRRGLPVLKALDIATPAGTLGYAIARIGCFLNGCCFGLPTRLPWGVEFPFGSLAYTHYPHAHIHPTQLYASASMLLVFLFVLWLYRRKKFDGQVFFWALVLYAVYRFIVEFFRYCPETLYLAGLNPGQLISLLLIAGGLFGLWRARRPA